MRTVFFLFLIFVSAKCFSQIKSVSVQVSGLTCAMCSKTVQNSLEKISFVKAVKPDLNSQEYQLTFRESSAVNLEEIKKEIEDAGFSVARLQVIADFTGVSVQKNLPVRVGTLLFQFLEGENKVLTGERTLTLLEKDFLSTKAFKKYCGGSPQKCSVKELSIDGKRIYKVVT